MDNASTAAVSSVIMTDVMIYVVGSLLIIALLDFYALKKIGDKRRPAYQELKVIGVLCMFKDLTVSRYTLTYFGLPYFLALVYYMVKIFRRVRSEERRRRF